MKVAQIRKYNKKDINVIINEIEIPIYWIMKF